MFATRTVLMPDGSRKPLTANISAKGCAALYRTVLALRPVLVVEIGMAHGVSTLSILAGLMQTGGRLISIDPYTDWESGKLAALHGVYRAGFAGIHRHLQLRSYEALPRLLLEETRVDLGYIDGCHDFDHAFIDFFFLDRMIPPGGVLGFNDAGWPTVFKVIQYLRKHREYEELDVGLKPDYSARNALLGVARRILNMPRQDRYFCKTGDTK